MNARDIAYGYGIGYNDGLNAGGGGNVGKDIVGVVPFGSLLTVYTTTDRSAETPTIIKNDYILTIENICKITFTKFGNQTITNKWSASFITDISKADGSLLFHAEYDENAELCKIVNAENDEIYLSEPPVLSGKHLPYSVADGVTLGYMVGANKIASELIAELIEAYKTGLSDSNSDADVTSDDVIIPDGSAIAIHETGTFKYIYYGSSSGIIISANDSDIRFLLNYSKATVYLNGELIRTDYDSSISATKNFKNTTWILIGDWYYRDTGEKYEGQGVSQFGTAF